MLLLEFIWTFSGIATGVIVGLVLVFMILLLIYELIMMIVHKLFYKNCRNCKHFKLHNTTSYGGFASYKCDETKEISKNLLFNDDYWKRCKKFEK